MHPLAAFPSPTRAVWHLGPLPIRAYALCIVAGILVALWLTSKRLVARHGTTEDVWDVAGWAIVFGIIGGRLYHVITDWQLYFGKGRNPADALKIWDGGLGIWGAIALGGLGAWIGCRRKSIALPPFADAAAPGIVLAQGIGRWGNWFNNELYGGPTSLPWGLRVHCMDIITGAASTHGTADGGQVCNGSATVPGLFQPTFLYEFLWDVGVAVLVIWADRRFRLGRGNAFALYVMSYTAGRAWIEALRHDPAHHILGLRLNDWTALVVFLGGLFWFIQHGGFRAPREETPYTGRRVPIHESIEPDQPADAETSDDSDSSDDAATSDDAAEPDDARTG